MSLRLGLVHENLARTGGAENVVLWTARGLAARGHAVRVISTALPGQLPPGVEGVRLSLEGSLRRTATHRRAAAALAPHLAGLDVLNVTNFPASAWAHLALRERPGPPLTLTYHEPPRHLYEPVMDAEYLASPLNVSRRPLTVWFDHWALGALRRLDREAVRAAAAVIANSPYSAGKIRQIYGIEPVVLNFAVPDEEDPPPPPRQG
ncbi:MAG TPA: glycosyltransferase family 4 protein, partial [Candidatus Nitrosotenuis sp.]|nr:glycosyltransferase family 4 protein [Candidatus Nitrosotenuis sp.]